MQDETHSQEVRNNTNRMPRPIWWKFAVMVLLGMIIGAVMGILDFPLWLTLVVCFLAGLAVAPFVFPEDI